VNTQPNRVLLMSASAGFLGLLGLAGSFLPHELLAWAGAPVSGAGALLVQLAGALSLSFAMVNWMGRTNLIGGVYSRPVAAGNTLHFTMGALALLKGVSAGNASLPFVLLLALYAIFACAFAFMLLTHPLPERR
jgi:hypothetical protein